MVTLNLQINLVRFELKYIHEYLVKKINSMFNPNLAQPAVRLNDSVDRHPLNPSFLNVFSISEETFFWFDHKTPVSIVLNCLQRIENDIYLRICFKNNFYLIFYV